MSGSARSACAVMPCVIWGLPERADPRSPNHIKSIDAELPEDIENSAFQFRIGEFGDSTKLNVPRTTTKDPHGVAAVLFVGEPHVQSA
jgi:hypothetical protein